MNIRSIGPFAAVLALVLMVSGNAQAEAEAAADEAAAAAAGADDGAEAEPTTSEAEPMTSEAEPMSDEDFAKSLIGQSYKGSFDLDGWTSLGGGLVLPPIYVQQYTRDDGKILVFTAKQTEAAGRGSSANFEIADTLLTGKPRRGYTFSTACMKGEDYTLRYMGEASGKDAAEWWTNLRKAWEIDVETGKISSLKARGVKCTNPNW